jgi:hypothetical protein
MVPSGMLLRVALVRTNVSEEPSAFFIRVTRIGELGTTLAATSTDSCHPDEGGAKFLQHWFLQKPHGVTSPKTPFFIVTAVKTSNLILPSIIFMYVYTVVIFLQCIWYMKKIWILPGILRILSEACYSCHRITKYVVHILIMFRSILTQ